MTAARKRTLFFWIGAGVVVGIVAVLAGTGVLPIAGAGKSHDSSTPAAKPGNDAPITVTVATVTPRPVQRKVQVVGTLAGYEELTVTPKIEGIVTKIVRHQGDAVKPGDVLLEIEETYYTLAVQEAEKALELELAKIGLKELPQGELDIDKVPAVIKAKRSEAQALLDWKRAKDLYAKDSLAKAEHEKAESDYDVAKATSLHVILETRSTLATAKYRSALLDTAKKKFTETKVRAPEPSPQLIDNLTKACALFSVKPDKSAFQYKVAKRLVAEGEMVRAFPSVAVYKLIIEHPLKLVALVPERFMGEIEVGQDAHLFVEAFPKQTFKGKVALIDPTVDKSSRTFQVEIVVPNKTHKLKAGCFARVAIATHVDPAAPTIPEEALITFAGVSKVFTVKDGKAHAVAIEPGARLEVNGPTGKQYWLEVSGALKAQDAVVTSGYTKLIEGSAVKIRQ